MTAADPILRPGLELGGEYLDAISDAIVRHPRSLQAKVGPSELGQPCARRIGYKLLNRPEREQAPNWKATVGTATHSWLEGVFDQWNVDNCPDGVERFLIETRVSVGDVNGVEITGSCDLYDRRHDVVTDWKTTGPTALQKYKRKGPGPQYRAQAHLYGRGWQRAGYHVAAVQIVFLPRNGDLFEAYIWSEPYDEEVAIDALRRASGIALAVDLRGTAGLDALPTAAAFCHLCPYFKARSADLAEGCPGDPGSPVQNFPTSSDPFA